MIDKHIVKNYKPTLDELFARYNRREFVHPDPLEFLYNYNTLKDREIVGLIASCLAYGRVHQILKSVATALERIGSPAEFVKMTSEPAILDAFQDFKHRFTTGLELACLLIGIKRTLDNYGSLGLCFQSGFKEEETMIYGLSNFVEALTANASGQINTLLPHPKRGSACKRLNLYLRWMVRKDEVDPGGWDNIPPSSLIVPLDTHMHRISLGLGLTDRKQADMRTALEITQAFEIIAPHDPVRYDFCLTRLGIRNDITPHEGIAFIF
jgi:uncharacterized protein (TIGR02757 family)